MTVIERESLLDTEPDFSHLVRYYMKITVQAVQAEDGGTANHAARLALAKLMTANLNLYVRRFAEMVMTDPTVASRDDLTDIEAHEADIADAVTAFYNLFI